MREEWMNIGIDYEELVSRLGNSEKITEKFLKRFLEDETFAHLQADYNRWDIESLIRDVHTLKGIAGNLSMKPLYAIVNTWLTDLRARNYRTSEALYTQCLMEYQKICVGLQDMFQEQGVGQ